MFLFFYNISSFHYPTIISHILCECYSIFSPFIFFMIIFMTFRAKTYNIPFIFHKPLLLYKWKNMMYLKISHFLSATLALKIVSFFYTFFPLPRHSISFFLYRVFYFFRYYCRLYVCEQIILNFFTSIYDFCFFLLLYYILYI